MVDDDTSVGRNAEDFEKHTLDENRVAEIGDWCYEIRQCSHFDEIRGLRPISELEACVLLQGDQHTRFGTVIDACQTVGHIGKKLHLVIANLAWSIQALIISREELPTLWFVLISITTMDS